MLKAPPPAPSHPLFSVDRVWKLFGIALMAAWYKRKKSALKRKEGGLYHNFCRWLQFPVLKWLSLILLYSIVNFISNFMQSNVIFYCRLSVGEKKKKNAHVKNFQKDFIAHQYSPNVLGAPAKTLWLLLHTYCTLPSLSQTNSGTKCINLFFRKFNCTFFITH